MMRRARRSSITEVETNGREHSVGCDQERKDVEALFRIAFDQAGSRSGRGLHVARDILGVPRPSIHQNAIVRIEYGVMAKK
jgi:hypothetical protein